MLSTGIYTTLVYYFSDRRLDQMGERVEDF